MNRLKRLAALERWYAARPTAAALTDEERAQQIHHILTTEPDSPRAQRIRELLAVARQRMNDEP